MKKSAPKETNSLKTFFLYAFIVTILIVISLSLKAAFLIQQSKFDGQNQFVLALTKDNKVKEVAAFVPANHTLSLLEVEGTLPKDSLGNTIGIIPDAWIAVPSDALFKSDIADTLQGLLWQLNTTKTNVTVIDLGRLVLLSQSIPLTDRTIEKLNPKANPGEIDTIVNGLFKDALIESSALSVQIVNASGQQGLGGRLERVLDNMGMNVVSVSTARKPIVKSNIAYYGSDTYPLQKLKRLLQFPVKQMQTETIADIVITIGEDKKSTKMF